MLLIKEYASNYFVIHSVISQMIDRFAISNRKAKLQAWLAYHGVLKSQLAQYLGVHPSMVTRMLRSDRAPAKRIAQLKEFGIPEELLPLPSRPPGRPAKQTFHHRPATNPSQQNPTEEDTKNDPEPSE